MYVFTGRQNERMSGSRTGTTDSRQTRADFHYVHSGVTDCYYWQKLALTVDDQSLMVVMCAQRQGHVTEDHFF